MNYNNFDKIIHEYINHFDLINNNSHNEFSKWLAFKRFKDYFDIEAEDFASMFKNAIKDAAWLVDNAFVCPTNGIVYFAEKPETKERVRSLFRDLYTNDDGDLTMREAKIWKFVDDFNTMLDQYAPNKWKYKQEFRYALLYLTIMYPDSNFLYKSSQAQAFARCIEYDRPLGSGREFSLKNYYHMCDIIIEKIKDTPELIALQKSRINNDMYQDSEYHLLTFNIIYCAVAYGMYSGIEIKKPKKMTASERAELARNENLQNQLVEAEAELNQVLDLYDTIENISIVGLNIEHKQYGIGIVTEQDGTMVTIKFSDKTTVFQFPTAFTVGKLIFDDKSLIEYFTTLYETVTQKKKLEDRIKSIENRLK
ncbi:MAG: hypothetical protein IKR97_02010 [Eubacterium sp.]|nr:hypothetical protein [Eubacterium sp.]